MPKIEDNKTYLIEGDKICGNKTGKEIIKFVMNFYENTGFAFPPTHQEIEEWLDYNKYIVTEV